MHLPWPAAASGEEFQLVQLIAFPCLGSGLGVRMEESLFIPGVCGPTDDASNRKSAFYGVVNKSLRRCSSGRVCREQLADSTENPPRSSVRSSSHPSIHQVVVHKLLGLSSYPEEEEEVVEGVVGALVTRHLLELILLLSGAAQNPVTGRENKQINMHICFIFYWRPRESGGGGGG